MSVQYYPSESNSRPLDIEITASADHVYIRRNIRRFEEEISIGGEHIVQTKYRYEEALITKDEFESYKNELLVKLINSEDNTREFDTYYAKINTPVMYSNQHTYKPKWADAIYFGLIQKGLILTELFPMKIYDSTGKDENAVMMSLEELKALALFLEQKKEQAFLEYKRSLQ